MPEGKQDWDQIPEEIETSEYRPRVVKKIFGSMAARLENYYAKIAKEFVDEQWQQETLWNVNGRTDSTIQAMKRIRLKHFGATNEERQLKWLP